MEIILYIGISMATSVVVTKILATHYFEIVDSYVKDICDKTEKIMKYVKAKVDNFL